jgi:hypothetical protein
MLFYFTALLARKQEEATMQGEIGRAFALSSALMLLCLDSTK